MKRLTFRMAAGDGPLEETTLQGGGHFTPGFLTTLTNRVIKDGTPDWCFAADSARRTNDTGEAT